MGVHQNRAFAPVDRHNDLHRVAGGNETEVYCTDDQRFVIKLKAELGASLAEALAHAQAMRAAAEEYAACLGPQHSIPSYYLLSRDDEGEVQVLVVQPFLRSGKTLYELDYGRLRQSERRAIVRALRAIIGRSLRHYAQHQSMPDLYGRTSSSSSERKRLNTPWRIPHRLWSFIVQRNLLRAHNLMYLATPEPQVVLVDYDYVRRSSLYRATYFLARRLLFWRDRVFLLALHWGLWR